jgi:formylglycine-generating enzyme required for sulfatase activity
MLLVCVAVSAAADQPLTTPRHPVFAHYMVCFGLDVEMCRQEIELAQRHGIDGFALNCGEWCNVDAQGNLVPTRYVTNAETLYEAARQLRSGFKLFFSPDLSGLRDLPRNMGDMVKRFESHPNQLRWDGKVVLSGWGGSPAAYADAVRAIKPQVAELCFVPHVSNERYAMAWSLETVLNLFHGQPDLDGAFYFACDDSVAGTLRTNATARRATQYLGKLYMAGACAHYNSANLRDFHGFEGYGAQWDGIIRDAADWVELVTWNDYNEDSSLMPYRWKDGWDRELCDHDESDLDVTGYYSAAFHTGRTPAITQDKLYVMYRDRPVRQSRVWDAKGRRCFDSRTGPWPYDQIHDDVEDRVYVTTFLTAPAELRVRLGRTVKTFAQPAGIGHAWLPMSPGVPQFVLRRDGRTLLDVVGRRAIIAEETPLNSPFGQRLTQRAWTFGAAAGPVTRLEAAAGALSGQANLVQTGGMSAVANAEQDGSGFTVPVNGLATATYNVRIVYSNPGPEAARLTLTADGAPRAAGDYPYYLPAFLPPTGRGRFATTSVFWSLYDTTTHLALQWRAGVGDAAAHRDDPLFNDRGRVLVSAIDLVKVEPVQPLATRGGMVSIPGGEFDMGRDDGKPDEQPVHHVKLAPFALGRYPVTNEEFERFDPAHRRFRDGFSWRDREPVIYVSWLDGARYCNWLSRQAGLTPAYAEETVDAKSGAKAWMLHADADGYRMPTEAQWEYAASGRGEGRAYPWGDAAPDAGRGCLPAGAALLVDPRLRSQDSAGTMAVGAFPAGASRDGVMDLAGNVCTWCSDWYQPYAAAEQSDPCAQAPSDYRALRGGSWGYYGGSQRCAAREFNNPAYGGYIYIGLRLALPQAGSDKVRSAP